MGVIFTSMILFQYHRGKCNNTNLQDKILRAPEIQKNNANYIQNFHDLEGIQGASAPGTCCSTKSRKLDKGDILCIYEYIVCSVYMTFTPH
jgi:hypothetical protein